MPAAAMLVRENAYQPIWMKAVLAQYDEQMAQYHCHAQQQHRRDTRSGDHIRRTIIKEKSPVYSRISA